MQRRTIYSPLLVLVLLVELSAITLLHPHSVQAAVMSWNEGACSGTGNWENGACWIGGVVPGAADTAAFNPTNNLVVTVTGAQTVARISNTNLKTTLVIAGDASLAITGAAASSINGPMVVNSGGTFTVGGTGQVYVFETLTVNGAVNVTGRLYIYDGATLTNNGTITYPTGPAGVFELDAGAVLNNYGTIDLQNDTNLSYNCYLGSCVNPAFNNYGTLKKTGGVGSDAAAQISFANGISGTVRVQAGDLYILNPSGFTSMGTLWVDTGTTLGAGGDIVNAGTLQGTGTLQPTSTLINRGVVRPGNSPGILTIDGNYTQTITGTLYIQINGTTVGTQYSQLKVTGQASLSGNLSINVGDFTPSSSDSFNVGDFGIQVGDFTSENVENKPGTVIDQSTSTDVIIALDPNEYIYLPLTIR